MKIYRVQYAYAREVGCPSIHKDEESALAEVAYLLGEWLMKNLSFKVRGHERWAEEPEFRTDATAILQEIPELVARGETWAAYDRWQDFYEKYEFAFGMPLYVQIGTVIVDTREIEPLRKRKTLPSPEVPPMVEYARKTTVAGMREEVEMAEIIRHALRKLEAAGRKLTQEEFERYYWAAAESATKIAQRELESTGRKFEFGELNVIFERELKRHMGLEGRRRGRASLGALRIWHIRYEEQEGRLHDSVHTDEEIAKGEVAERLDTIMDRLWSHVQIIKAAGRGRWAEQLSRMDTVIARVKAKIGRGSVWDALDDWNRRRREFDEFFGEDALTLLGGAIEVWTEEPR